MKVVLPGLICALSFIFQTPEEPKNPKDGGPKETPKAGEAPKTPATPTVVAPKNRFYVNDAGERLEFTSPPVVKMTRGKGQTLTGTYTKKNDLVRLSFNSDGKTTTMELIETAHGMAGMTEGKVNAFLGTNDREKIAVIKSHSNKAKMEANILTLVACLQVYTTKNLGQPPSGAVGLRPLITKRITTDESLLTDPWGQEVLYVVPAKRSKDKFDVFSAGPNGVEGDADDIGNWKSEDTADKTDPEVKKEFKAFKKEVEALGDRLKETKDSVQEK